MWAVSSSIIDRFSPLSFVVFSPVEKREKSRAIDGSDKMTRGETELQEMFMCLIVHAEKEVFPVLVWHSS